MGSGGSMHTDSTQHLLGCDIFPKPRHLAKRSIVPPDGRQQIFIEIDHFISGWKTPVTFRRHCPTRPPERVSLAPCSAFAVQSGPGETVETVETAGGNYSFCF